MASRPPVEPPESVVLGQFAGIRNLVSEERLQPGELSVAKNVDIDDAGQLRRRRGQTLISNALHHSLEGPIGSRWLVVRSGVLGFLTVGLEFTALITVGAQPLSYTSVGDTIFFSSMTHSGQIVENQVLPWGQSGGEAQWISPVVTPTDTLGAVRGRLLAPPPLAAEIEHYMGRVYLAVEKILWYTELYLYGLVDRNQNFIPFEHEITMIEAVSDGLYVGTTAELLFLAGTVAKGLKMTSVISSPVIRGSAVRVPYSKVHPQARQGPVPEGEGPVFMTAAGICVGLDGGQVYNLTQGAVGFPEAQRAAALYREDQGANSYVAAMDGGGSPVSNVRIGDYVDAEIRRGTARRAYAVDELRLGDVAEAEII